VGGSHRLKMLAALRQLAGGEQGAADIAEGKWPTRSACDQPGIGAYSL
jgi:hypothetical protein